MEAPTCIRHGRLERGSSDAPPQYSVNGTKFPQFAHCADASKSSWTWRSPDQPACNAEYPATSWCAALEGRSVLFVGDSLAQQQVFSLLHLLDAAPSEEVSFADWLRSNDTLVCGGRARVNYVRNDLLCEPRAPNRRDICTNFPSENTDGIRLLPRSMYILRPFYKLAVSGYNVLVINTGQHVVPRNHSAILIQRLATWIRDHIDASIDVIWRTSVVGHQNCTESHRRDTPLMAPYTPLASHPTFSWHRITPDEHMRWRILNAVLPEGRVRLLDAATLANRRQDRHLIYKRRGRDGKLIADDCLHWCLPGPPDDWNRALRAMLLEGRPKSKREAGRAPLACVQPK